MSNLLTLYIGNLSQKTTAEQLGKLLEKYGPVESVNINTLNDVSKGFGFAKMQNGDAARNAIENLNNYVLDGRPLKVNFANRGSGYPSKESGWGRNSGGRTERDFNRRPVRDGRFIRRDGQPRRFGDGGYNVRQPPERRFVSDNNFRRGSEPYNSSDGFSQSRRGRDEPRESRFPRYGDRQRPPQFNRNNGFNRNDGFSKNESFNRTDRFNRNEGRNIYGAVPYPRNRDDRFQRGPPRNSFRREKEIPDSNFRRGPPQNNFRRENNEPGGGFRGRRGGLGGLRNRGTARPRQFQGELSKTRVHVNNLPESLTAQELAECFPSYKDSIKEVTIRPSRFHTNQNAGFGFIELNSEEEQERLLKELPNVTIKGKTCYLHKAHNEPAKK